MEAGTFSPGTVFPYLVEWNNVEGKIQVRQMDENLTLGKLTLKGGDKDADYKNYYLGMKYMIYCEDGDGNLVIHSFAVDYRTICWVLSGKLEEYKNLLRTDEDKKSHVLKADMWRKILADPGFNVPDGEKEGYEMKIAAIMSDQNAFDIKAEINFDENLGGKIASCINDCFDEYKAKDLTPKILAFSDVHGGVLSYAIGVKMMKKLKKTHKDLITVCEGDAIGRKGDYYAGKKIHGVWNAGKFPDLASIYIIYHVRQLVDADDSMFIYLHGNHDYAIEYPTVMSYTTKNYQLIFSHGMIEPQLLDELKAIPMKADEYNDDIDRNLDDELVYPSKFQYIPEVKLFAFGKKSIARKTKNNLFGNENDDQNQPKITSIFSSDIERPTEGWDEKVKKLTALQTRDYLTNYFFIPANIKKFGKGEVIPKGTLDQMNNALLALYKFAVGAIDKIEFNPIFTFGHDYNYEVWSYYAQLKIKNGDLSKFPLNDELWKYDYNWETEKNARLKDHLMARVFCVDGNHYLDEEEYKGNGPYTKINKYIGKYNDLEVDKRETTDDDTSVGSVSIEGEEEEVDEQSEGDGFIERILKQDGKSVSFTRCLLAIYYADGVLQGEVSGIYDECHADDVCIDSTTFKLIVIYKDENSDEVAISEIFFQIFIDIDDGNRTEIVEKIAETLEQSYNELQPLFFIFSPSMHTLECFQGVLECAKKYPDAYCIATSSPLSVNIKKLDSSQNIDSYYDRVSEIASAYNGGDIKYIELFDPSQVKSYAGHEILTNPVAVMLNLPNVNILLSNSIYYLNRQVLKESRPTTGGAEIVAYHYDLNEIANAVNKDFPDAPEIPMTERSLVNLMKSIFDERNEYDLSFRPERLDHITISQSSLKDEKRMAVNEPTVISTADVKWKDNNNNAIDNLYGSLFNVLVPPDELEDILKRFFDANSNPLILTSDPDDGKLFQKYEGNSLKEAIEFHDEHINISTNNFMLSRLYSLYSDRQWIKEESSHETESEQVENAPVRNVPTNDGAMGGVVTSKKKAIIISIILGAILIIVIVVVVIVTSHNEGFKPRMGKIKP